MREAGVGFFTVLVALSLSLASTPLPAAPRQAPSLTDRQILALAESLFGARAGEPSRAGRCGSGRASILGAAVQPAAPAVRRAVDAMTRALPEALDQVYVTPNFLIVYDVDPTSQHVVFNATDTTAGFLGQEAPRFIVNLGEYLETSAQQMSALGFRDPFGAGPMEVVVAHLVDFWGFACPLDLCGILIDNDLDPLAPQEVFDQLRVLAAHELFHKVQYEYAPPLLDEPLYLYEGTAEWIEDAIYDDVNAYVEYVDALLASPDETRVRFHLSLPEDGDYETVLYWKFFAERYGSKAAEPAVGVDAIRALWEATESPLTSGGAVVSSVIGDLTGGDIDGVRSFLDWSVANFAKETISPPAAFSYREAALYGNVLRTWTGTLDLDVPGLCTHSMSDSLRPWGTDYLELHIADSVGSVELRFDGADGLDRFLPIQVVLLDGNAAVGLEERALGVGNTAQLTVTSAGTRIVLVLAGGRSGGAYDLVATAGPGPCAAP